MESGTIPSVLECSRMPGVGIQWKKCIFSSPYDFHSESDFSYNSHSRSGFAVYSPEEGLHIQDEAIELQLLKTLLDQGPDS